MAAGVELGQDDFDVASSLVAFFHSPPSSGARISSRRVGWDFKV